MRARCGGANQQGGLEAFYASGKVRFVFQTRRTFNPWGADRTTTPTRSSRRPAVGDITGDGQLDIVFGSYDHYIYALQPNGRLVPGFPVNRADTIWSSPTLVDTSHTGRDDIIMGGDASGFEGCRGGWLVDYRYVAGGPRLVWQRCMGQTIWSSPTVGILNDTGRPAVVVGTSYYTELPQRGHRRDPRRLRRQREQRARLAGQGDRAHLRLAGNRASSTASKLSSRRLAPAALSGPAVVSAWSGSGQHDLVNGVRRPQRSHLVAGSRGHHRRARRRRRRARRRRMGPLPALGRNGGFLYNTGAWASTLDMGCDAPSSAAVAYVPGAPGNGWMLYSACGGPTLPATLHAYPFPVAPCGRQIRLRGRNGGPTPTAPGSPIPVRSLGPGAGRPAASWSATAW